VWIIYIIKIHDKSNNLLLMTNKTHGLDNNTLINIELKFFFDTYQYVLNFETSIFSAEVYCAIIIIL